MTHIIFFNGWGMDKGIISHFNDQEDYLVTEVHSYHQYHAPKLKKNTTRTIVIAWSLGTILATKFYIQHAEYIDRFIVINGACDGFNKKQGLPKAISMLTAKNWNSTSKLLFDKKMNGSDLIFVPTNRTIEDQKKELLYLMDHQDTLLSDRLQTNDSKILVLISEKEQIYPSKNLIRCWKDQKIVIIKDKYHNPFHTTSSWKQWIEN
ncbi:DUF452 family protein [Prolixibacteraceae bacterium]|nr:DUF452 family protein [Prolixibacteraceae bacterium]